MHSKYPSPLLPIPYITSNTPSKHNHPHHHHHHHQYQLKSVVPKSTSNSTFYVFHPRPALKTGEALPREDVETSKDEGEELNARQARSRSIPGVRRTVDYNSSVVRMLQARVWQRDHRDQRAIQPDVAYYTQMLPPMWMMDNPSNCITGKLVRSVTNKMRCPIFAAQWTPEGRRLVTGAASGELTLWNGLTFNFETILQAHDSPVKVMVWSHGDSWLVTADQMGYVKYWQCNMNSVKMFQAHHEPVRGVSFAPGDSKFATCSDDASVRVWDFVRCAEERVMRGHGAEVKAIDWHPTKALIASGSKDTQQPVKLWHPVTGRCILTLHCHKSTVTSVKWNRYNENWLLTSSRDHLIKLFDLRKMSTELMVYRGHRSEVTSLAWHPFYEGSFVSGATDGSIRFWSVDTDREIEVLERAHESTVWALTWHPLGHILTSVSNDHSSKFWTRNRPGDLKCRRKVYNKLSPSNEIMDSSLSSETILSYINHHHQEEILPGF